MHTMISKILDFTVPENCVCFNLRWVTRAVTQFFDAEMRRHGIRPTQGTILLALNAKESWTMAELSDCLGLERTSLVRNLQPLQRDGLVTADGGGRGNRSRLGVYAHVGWWWGGVDYIVCFYWYLASCNQGGGICSLVLRDRCEGRLGCELEDGVALDMLAVGGCRWFGCYGCGGCGFCVCLCGGLRIHFE